MRIPATPPDFREVFRRQMKAVAAGGPGELNVLAARAAKASPIDGKGRYLHWEDFRFRPTPDGIDPALWWSLVRRAREARASALPLTDKRGAAFFFVPTDTIARALHEIDSQTRGGVRLDTIVPSDMEAKSFLITSLIEEPFNSSVLEGAVATRERAKKIIRENREPKTLGERMIVNNYRAIEFIKRQKDEALTPALVCELHRLTTAGTLENPAMTGVLRRPQDNINVEDVITGDILHAPPPAQTLPARLDALCEFANSDDEEGPFIHPILRAVMLHFMLAYDHPFVDGNGRTARALYYWAVVRYGYWLLEYVSISKAINEAPTRYGMAFLETETDEGDLTYFINHQLDMILTGIKSLYAFIDKKKAEVETLQKVLSDGRLRASFNHRQLALLNEAARASSRIFTIEEHRKAHGVSYLTARKDLEGLAAANFLEKRKQGVASLYRPAKGLAGKLAQISGGGA